jgi:membrane protein YdbS with pleckstrin-like domain
VQTLKGRRWARIALSVFLIVATVASFASWSAGLQFQWSVIATDALHVLMIALLWLPGRSRRAHPAGALGR